MGIHQKVVVVVGGKYIYDYIPFTFYHSGFQPFVGLLYTIIKNWIFVHRP